MSKFPLIAMVATVGGTSSSTDSTSVLLACAVSLAMFTVLVWSNSKRSKKLVEHIDQQIVQSERRIITELKKHDSTGENQ